MGVILYPKLNLFLKLANTVDIEESPQPSIIDFYTYLKRALSFNSKMFGHYITRRSAVSSFGYSIEALNEDDLQRARESEARLNSVITKILSVQLNTVAFGSILFRVDADTRNNENKIVIKKVFSPDQYDYFGDTIYLYNNGKWKEIDLSDNENDFIFDAADYPHKGGLLRSVMPIEIMRYDMLVENGNYLRKLKGLLQIINKGGTEEDQAAAETAAANAVRENFFISSDAIDMKLNPLTGASGNGFKDFIELADSSISIAWLGNANLSELPKFSGSRAALQVQQMISADIFYTDMTRVENLINKFVLLDYRLNHDKNAVLSDVPWRFKFNLTEEQDVEKNASALEILNRFLPLKKSEAYKFVGFDAPGDGDELLEPNKENLI